MQGKIKNLIAVAEFLGDTGTKAILEKWLQSQQTGEKVLPFVGRFSAGKSSLINSLVHDRVLPTARVETTATLTKLSYAANPHATIVLSDGTVRTIDIAEVSDYTHANMGDKEAAVEAIHLNLPLDILCTGLTIVDSPGMDTIVNNHVVLARYLMEEAVIVVYVMAGAPSAFDMGIMRQLQANGVGIIAVRTHMDALKDEEESFLTAVENDEKVLSGLEFPVKYFALSSSADASESLRDAFRQFEDYLKNEISVKVKDVYDRKLSQRLLKIGERFRQDLLARRQLIESHAGKSDAEFDDEIRTVNKVIRNIERSIDALQEKLSKEKTKMKAVVLDEVDDDIDAAVRSFKKNLTASYASVPASADAQQKFMEDMFQQSLAKVSEKVSATVTERLMDWALKSTATVGEELLQMVDKLKAFDIPFDPDIDMGRVNDIADQQEALLEKIDLLTRQSQALTSLTDTQLTELGTRRETIEKTLEELEATHRQAVEALQYLDNNYEPRYIEKPSKMGEFMRRIGNAADIAMLAIPAIGWEKGAMMLSEKAASLAGKAGQLAQVGQKVLTAGSNVARVLAETDTVKDVTMLLDMTTKRLGNKDIEAPQDALVRISDKVLPPSPASPLPEKQSSVFDYLSLSYWFGKFGEWIDPPTREIDIEYENRYRQARQACEHNAYLTAKRRIDEERELGRIKSDAQAREMEHKFRQEALDRKKAQCEKRMEALSRKKDEAVRQAFIESAASQFKDAASKVGKYVGRHIDGILEGLYLQILSAASQSAYSQLESAKENLEAMKSNKKAAHDEKAAPVARIDHYLSLLPE